MPHITLEFSSNLPEPASIQTLLGEIHSLTHQVTGVNLENCKSRCYRASDFRVGAGNAEAGFVHLEVRFIEGRSKEIKKTLATELNTVLRNHFDEACQTPEVQVTVEVSDILLDEYAKYPEGSLTQQ